MANLGGTFTFPGTSRTVNRVGYGAMQLAGPHVFGPPKDRAACIAVLHAAVEAGVNHIDTSDFYGPHITNQIIKEALHPYKDDLTIVTKVGAKRDSKGGWPPARSAKDVTEAVHDNLRNLGMDSLHIVNMRIGGMNAPMPGSLAEPFTALAELQQQGLIQHLGVSNVNAAQLTEAQGIAPVVCVQNMYNVVHRADDAFLHTLAGQGIAYVPFFPLGGFTPIQSSVLNEVAAAENASVMQVALAWLLQRTPNMLLIPGTSSVAHLRENLAVATFQLSANSIEKLDSIVT